MTGEAELLRLIDRLERDELEAWIRARWVRPEQAEGGWRFTATDVARVRLIFEIRHEMGVESESVAVVLDLLDQLYALRRQLRALGEALAEEPEETRAKLLARCRHLLGARPER
jgi:chaperone modulatory protein CbpM